MTGSHLTTRGVINRLRREGWAERGGNWIMIFTKSGFNPIIVPDMAATFRTER